MIRIDIGITSDDDRSAFFGERLAMVVDLVSRRRDLLGRWLSLRVHSSEDTASLKLAVLNALEQFITRFLADFLQNLDSRHWRFPFDASVGHFHGRSVTAPRAHGRGLIPVFDRASLEFGDGQSLVEAPNVLIDDLAV